MKTIHLLILFTLTFFINSIGQNSTSTKTENLEKKEKREIAKLEKAEIDSENSEKSEKTKKELSGIKYRLLQDNSFFVEEAFAQEEDAIQHTYKFRRSISRKGWEGLFEEELPLGNEKHQLSIGIPMLGFNSTEVGKTKGFGDVEIGYRYQLLGGETSTVSVAPEVSVSIPTASYRRELGDGSIGLGFSIPVSIAINKRFMSHSNVGVSFTPRARNTENHKAFKKNVEIGQSIVWLAHPKINPLIEVVWERNQEVIGNTTLRAENELFVSPGVRWGHSFRNGLTIVPGVAFPIGFGSSKGENGILFYLSFEHPFKKREK